MKKQIQKWIAVVLLTFGISLPSHASVTCMAPDPACAVILLGALVTGIVSGTGDQEARALQAGPGPEKLAAVVDQIETMEDGRLAARLRNSTGDRPGFRGILNRFEHGRHEGPGSLDALMERDPQLFEDLDRIAAVIEGHYPDAVMADRYGPKRLDGSEVNWDRYATLARDALTIRRNMKGNGR